jgi:hypothetical protein
MSQEQALRALTLPPAVRLPLVVLAAAAVLLIMAVLLMMVLVLPRPAVLRGQTPVLLPAILLAAVLLAVVMATPKAGAHRRPETTGREAGSLATGWRPNTSSTPIRGQAPLRPRMVRGVESQERTLTLRGKGRTKRS